MHEHPNKRTIRVTGLRSNKLVRTTGAVLLSASVLVSVAGCVNEHAEANRPVAGITDAGAPIWTPAEEDAIATVERFLVVAGNYDLDGMKEMVAEKANVGVMAFQDGSWFSSSQTFEEYFKDAEKRELLPYYEPVGEYVVQVTEDQIAFVWADALLHRLGVRRSRNVDNFMMIREDGEWRFINISFTRQPFAAEERVYDLEMFAGGYSQAWSGVRPEFVAMHFAEDGSLSVNGGEPAVGRDAIAGVARGFMTDLPDMVVKLDSLRVAGDAVEFHWTLTGTNTGPGGTGNAVRISGYEEWTLNEDGLILESLGHFDAEEYSRQIEEGVEG